MTDNHHHDAPLSVIEIMAQRVGHYRRACADLQVAFDELHRENEALRVRLGAGRASLPKRSSILESLLQRAHGHRARE